MMRTKFVAALAAGLLAVPMAASAAIVTQLIHFDDANNGWGWYSDKDRNFLFNPTNLQSGNCALSTAGGNGSCVIEPNQGVLPLMTRPTNWGTAPAAGLAFGDNGPNKQPSNYGISGKASFTLNSFYFFLDGNGSAGENAITVTDNDGTTFDFLLGGTYTGPIGTSPVVTLYTPPGVGGAAGALDNQIGYIVNFGDLFKDVTEIQFSSAGSAQVRLDCIVATFDGSTTEGLKPGTTCGLGNGGPPPTDLPEPGTLGLLSLALLGLGVAGRRRLN